ncbi:MAG: large conductance mechanosensitive channel protein MscL [Limnothrix sp.]
MNNPKKQGWLSKFKDFIMRGNVVDLAVAVIIGAAFSKIVNSLVTDIITPAILQPILKAARLDELSELSFNGIKYGLFIAAVINFLVVAFSVFVLVQIFEGIERRARFKKAVEESKTEPVEPDPAVLAQERLTLATERLANLIENKNRPVV